MKDCKVLHYFETEFENSIVTLKEWGRASFFQENTRLEQLLFPYLSDGYRIISFSGDAYHCVIILVKD